MRLTQFRIEGLGHLSTLLADDDAGVAAVVDPRRDIDIYLDAARAADLRITHVVETHLHNDYVSGGRDLAALTGATHVIGVGAELGYEHRGLRDEESFAVGALRFTALETPGHTPEHVAYAVADARRADDPALLLTGGSLLVGAVGRTDLLGEEHAVPYARAMHATLHDTILRQADYVTIYPTHGAGSLCSTGIAAATSSTIGYERRHNRLLDPDLDAAGFAERLLRGQPAFPRYFARMRPINQAGPHLLGGRLPHVPTLAPDDVEAAVAGGAVVVDARPAASHAVGHVPGSISIPVGPSFGTWLGWVIEPDRPIVLVLDHTDDLEDLERQALRIGCDTVIGVLQGGMGRWSSEGRPIDATGALSIRELAAALEGTPSGVPLLIDVRQATEYDRGHVPGSMHLMAGTLPERLAELPRDRPIVTICATGFRSSIAASVLRAAGFEHVSSVPAGVPGWAAAGYPVELGADADSSTDGAQGPRASEDSLVTHHH